MPLLVHIVPPSSAPAEHAALLLEACSETAPEPCGQLPPDASRPPGATVQWMGDYDSVRIWVGAGGASQYRTLDFASEDPVEDRIRAAGLLVGAIARQARPPSREPTAVPSTKAGEAVSSTASPTPGDSAPIDAGPPFGSVGLMAFTGAGLGVRAGLRSELRLGRRGGSFGSYTSVAYAADLGAPAGLTTRALEVGGGLRLQLQLAPWSTLALQAGFCWQELAATAERGARSASGGLGRAGAEGLVGVAVPSTSSAPLAVVFQGRVAAFPASPSILVESQEVAQLKHVEPSGQLGIEARF